MGILAEHPFNRRECDWEDLEAALEDLANAKKYFYEAIKDVEKARDRYRQQVAYVQRAKEVLSIWDEEV